MWPEEKPHLEESICLNKNYVKSLLYSLMFFSIRAVFTRCSAIIYIIYDLCNATIFEVLKFLQAFWTLKQIQVFTPNIWHFKVSIDLICDNNFLKRFFLKRDSRSLAMFEIIIVQYRMVIFFVKNAISNAELIWLLQTLPIFLQLCQRWQNIAKSSAITFGNWLNISTCSGA